MRSAGVILALCAPEHVALPCKLLAPKVTPHDLHNAVRNTKQSAHFANLSEYYSSIDMLRVTCLLKAHNALYQQHLREEKSIRQGGRGAGGM